MYLGLLGRVALYGEVETFQTFPFFCRILRGIRWLLLIDSQKGEGHEE